MRREPGIEDGDVLRWRLTEGDDLPGEVVRRRTCPVENCDGYDGERSIGASDEAAVAFTEHSERASASTSMPPSGATSEAPEIASGYASNHGQLY